MSKEILGLLRLRGCGGLALGAVVVALGTQLGMVALVLPAPVPQARAAVVSPDTSLSVDADPRPGSQLTLPAPVDDNPGSGQAELAAGNTASPVLSDANAGTPSAVQTEAAESEAETAAVASLSAPLPPDGWLRAALTVADSAASGRPPEAAPSKAATAEVESAGGSAVPATQQASAPASAASPEPPAIPIGPAPVSVPAVAEATTPPAPEPTAAAATVRESAAMADAGQLPTPNPSAWLAEAPDRHWVVQLAASRSRERVERLASTHRLSQLRTLMVETERSGRPWYSLIHGVHADFETAAAVGRDLAHQFGEGEPWIRRVQEVRSAAVTMVPVGAAIGAVATAAVASDD